jgi:galactose mutarotase-like enzyme
MIYQLKNEVLTVEIASLGAELVSVKKNGKERLWQNENGGWNGHAPILFPKCGDCRFIIGDTEYPMGGHGFVRKNEFELVEKGEDFIKLAVSSNENTKKVYPYDFRFIATYTLDGARLKIDYETFNPSSEPIYFACGSHESYALDGEIEEFEAVFPEEEEFVSPIHTEEARGFTGEAADFGKGKVIRFPREFMEDNTLIFANVKSREVEVRRVGGETVCKVFFEGFDNILFWRPEGSRMVCVEPWLNLPDLTTKPIGDFRQKAGVQKLEPNETKVFTHTIEY